MSDFYMSSEKIREKIRERSIELLSKIKESRVRDILMQRAKFSSFIKGILAYYIHDGLDGNFSSRRKVDLSSKLEIFSSSGAILDNVIDKHEERNGKTTYLREYGPTIQLFASQYALNYGLRSLFPFLSTFCEKFSNEYKLDQTILGMIQMDTGRSIDLDDHLKMTGSVNGHFNETILIMTASVVTEDVHKIKAIGSYGFNLGIGLGIYEELRDLLGKHGRKRATEVEEGRVITPLHIAQDFNYSHYIGRQLNKAEYKILLHELQKRGSLKRTSNLACDYFQKALNKLESAVNARCIQNIKPLHTSLESSMERMLVKRNS